MSSGPPVVEATAVNCRSWVFFFSFDRVASESVAPDSVVRGLGDSYGLGGQGPRLSISLWITSITWASSARDPLHGRVNAGHNLARLSDPIPGTSPPTRACVLEPLLLLLLPQLPHSLPRARVCVCSANRRQATAWLT